MRKIPLIEECLQLQLLNPAFYEWTTNWFHTNQNLTLKQIDTKREEILRCYPSLPLVYVMTSPRSYFLCALDIVCTTAPATAMRTRAWNSGTTKKNIVAHT